VSEKNEIAAALAIAQGKMGKAVKESTNPAFRAKYADLGNVMDACLPALNGEGISVIQPFRTDGDAFFVDTILLHKSGQSLSCSVPLIVNKRDMQGLGSAMTYARRYGLMAMAGIAPEDDDGNAAVRAHVRDPSHDKDSPADIAIRSLQGAETLDQLAAIWKDLGKGVQSLPEVYGAKDRRKDDLTKKPDTDFIPY